MRIKTNVHSKRMYIRHIIDHWIMCIGLNLPSKRMYIQNECTFKTNVHSKWMYIQNECTFKMNVHLAYHWSCLPHSVYYCHTVAMFATFWLWLPLFGHVCHILIMIAILWPCLPRFDYDCHTLGMFATFWAWLPYCSHVCHILSIIAALWPCFNYDCHTVSMIVVNCNVHLLQSVSFWIYFQHSGMFILVMLAILCVCLPQCGYNCYVFATNVHSKLMYI